MLDVVVGVTKDEGKQYTKEDLDAMSNEELEQICLQRGFELVKDDIDDATGEIIQFNRDDYIDAAMRCLAIEREMYVVIYRIL